MVIRYTRKGQAKVMKDNAVFPGNSEGSIVGKGSGMGNRSERRPVFYNGTWRHDFPHVDQLIQCHPYLGSPEPYRAPRRVGSAGTGHRSANHANTGQLPPAYYWAVLSVTLTAFILITMLEMT